jgi:prolipoprotein diacylglyceryl transferase
MIASITYQPIPIVHLGGFHLSIHGLFIALGFLAGAWIAVRAVERSGGDAERYQNVLSWALVGALVGARYLTAPAALLDGAGWGALSPLGGNFSIMGGFTGGILVGWWRMRSLGMDFLPTLDLSTTGLALGTVVGRLGCLAIAEHLGTATTLPWGFAVMAGYDVAPAHNGLECTVAQAGADGVCGVYQPVALYDLLGAAILLVVLAVMSRRIRLRPGQLFAGWMVWYGLQRFLLDSLRAGDAALGGFTWNQLVGLTGAIAGLFLMRWMGRRPKPGIDTPPPALRHRTGAGADPVSSPPLTVDR